MEIPFIGGAYLGRSSNLDSQRCKNFYPVVDKQGGRPLTLEGTPGLAQDTKFNYIDSADLDTTYLIGVNADSGGWKESGSFQAAVNSYDMGWRDATRGHIFFRIPTFTWYPCLTLSSFKVYVSVTQTTGVGDQAVKAYICTDADPAAPTSYAEVVALTLDSGSTSYNMGGTGGYNVSGEMSTQALAVINGSGFTSGDALVICVKSQSGSYYWKVNPLLSKVVISATGTGWY